MACSKLEARGHLLHKTGTPPNKSAGSVAAFFKVQQMNNTRGRPIRPGRVKKLKYCFINILNPLCNVTVAHYRRLHQDNGDTPTDLHLTIDIMKIANSNQGNFIILCSFFLSIISKCGFN